MLCVRVREETRASLWVLLGLVAPWCQSALDFLLGDGAREGQAAGHWIIHSWAMDYLVFFGPF